MYGLHSVKPDYTIYYRITLCETGFNYPLPDYTMWNRITLSTTGGWSKQREEHTPYLGGTLQFVLFPVVGNNIVEYIDPRKRPHTAAQNKRLCNVYKR